MDFGSFGFRRRLGIDGHDSLGRSVDIFGFRLQTVVFRGMQVVVVPKSKC